MPSSNAEAADALGQVLFILMLDNGLRHKELAEQVGVSAVTVSRWIHGKMFPPPGRRRQIERVIGLRQRSLDYPEQVLKELNGERATRATMRKAGPPPDPSTHSAQLTDVAKSVRALRTGLQAGDIDPRDLLGMIDDAIKFFAAREIPAESSFAALRREALDRIGGSEGPATS